jgi:hypothetical protein
MIALQGLGSSAERPLAWIALAALAFDACGRKSSPADAVAGACLSGLGLGYLRAQGHERRLDGAPIELLSSVLLACGALSSEGPRHLLMGLAQGALGVKLAALGSTRGSRNRRAQHGATLKGSGRGTSEADVRLAQTIREVLASS